MRSVVVGTNKVEALIFMVRATECHNVHAAFTYERQRVLENCDKACRGTGLELIGANFDELQFSDQWQSLPAAMERSGIAVQWSALLGD